MSGEAQASLEAFVVDNKDLEQLEALIAEFNIFEALGAVRQELRHSDFLAFLMDPSQNHGLGDAFLKRMLKRLLVSTSDPPLSAVEVDVADLTEATVQREWRQIDILVSDTSSSMVCAVENKIGSDEHSGQLRRYRETVSNAFPNDRPIFVYLTPDGDSPSDDAYIPFSYNDIMNLVEDVRKVHESTLGPDVRTLMTHYTAMLRRYIVSDSEIVQLCRRIYHRHKQALDLIFEHRPDLQWDLSELLKQLVYEAEPRGLIIDHSTKSYVRFSVAEWDRFPAYTTGTGWTPSRRILLFEFVNSADRLQINFTIGPGRDEVRQLIFQTAREHPHLFQRARKRLFPKWTTIYVKRFLTKRDYEDADIEGLAGKIRHHWDEFISRDLPNIKEVINRVEWPEIAAEDA